MVQCCLATSETGSIAGYRVPKVNTMGNPHTPSTKPAADAARALCVLAGLPGLPSSRVVDYVSKGPDGTDIGYADGSYESYPAGMAVPPIARLPRYLVPTMADLATVKGMDDVQRVRAATVEQRNIAIISAKAAGPGWRDRWTAELREVVAIGGRS
jgi:hypothetical protein